jgi:hypothetical protein
MTQGHEAAATADATLAIVARLLEALTEKGVITKDETVHVLRNAVADLQRKGGGKAVAVIQTFFHRHEEDR